MNDNLSFLLVQQARKLNATLLLVAVVLTLQWVLSVVAFVYFAQPAPQ